MLSLRTCIVLFGLLAAVKAQEPIVCDCGYVDEYNNVWSELWYADYGNYRSSLHYDRHYQVMDYTVSAKHKDTLDRVFSPGNVKVSSTEGITLTVQKDKNGRYTSAALGTKRSDFLYGTYRARMKMSNLPGTVAAFYFYRNNTCEIDVESLSRLNNPYKSYFAIQPQIYNADGSASSLTNEKHELQFNSTEDYHEYRFDWLPGVVKFYIDGQMVREMTTNVPDAPGRILLNHWTDGNPNFSGGPPTEDSKLKVSQLNMFFNSSDSKSPPVCIKSKSPCKIADIMSKTILPSSEMASSGILMMPSSQLFIVVLVGILSFYRF